MTTRFHRPWLTLALSGLLVLAATASQAGRRPAVQAYDWPQGLVATADGGSLVVVQSNFDVDPSHGSVLKLTAGGQLDRAFGAGGVVRLPTDSNPFAAAVYADGKIAVLGWIPVNGVSAYFLARLLPNGAFDASFGVAGIRMLTVAGQDLLERPLRLLPDGGFVASVWGVRNGVAKFDAAGNSDPTFGNAGVAETDWVVADIAATPDGGVVASGSDTGAGIAPGLVRFTPAGARDLSFGTGGSVSLNVADVGRFPGVVALGSGSLVVSGVWYPAGTFHSFPSVLKLNALGGTDPSFGVDGLYRHTIDDPAVLTWGIPYVHGVTAQSDGTLRLGAEVSRFVDGDAYETRMLFQLQLKPDGTPDASYAQDGSWFSAALPAKVVADDAGGYSVEMSDAFFALPQGAGCVAVIGDLSDNVDVLVTAYKADGSLARFGTRGVFTWSATP